MLGGSVAAPFLHDLEVHVRYLAAVPLFLAAELVVHRRMRPLLVFALQLGQARRTGLREHGTLAGRYVREFDAKRLRVSPPAGEPRVGSADIQSLADLGNGYEVVRTMRLSPITRDAIVRGPGSEGRFPLRRRNLHSGGLRQPPVAASLAGSACHPPPSAL